MRSILFASLAALACEPNASARASQLATAGPSAQTAQVEPAPAPKPQIPDTVRRADTAIVRGLYVLRWAAQSPARMKKLIAIADSTEINALVIDIKDEFGLNYKSQDTLVARNAGTAGTIPNLRAMIDTMKAHGVMPIARIVVFKDSVAARLNPQHTIRKADGGVWRDKEGLAWVSAYDPRIWEYNIRVAEEMARAGFAEVQFDYIRFPEPYRSLPKQVFPTANGRSKQQALAEFLRMACPRVRALGAKCTIDVFGLTTTVPGALEIGQHWESLSPHVDVMLPMTYPSHYPRGAFGIARPNAEPYRVNHIAIKRARERDEKLGIDDPGHVRAWLQAFSLPRMLPKYGPRELEEQKRAVYDAGYDSWILWNPGSRYESFMPGFEKTTESRRKRPDAPVVSPPVAAPAAEVKGV
ncbi:MAG TPA: putative glycoside hydrolase [Gemmatimonadaceae bacterium]|nr:putative glycoside hydrolase [Gemmatimonadaceae bacterium]